MFNWDWIGMIKADFIFGVVIGVGLASTIQLAISPTMDIVDWIRRKRRMRKNGIKPLSPRHYRR